MRTGLPLTESNGGVEWKDGGLSSQRDLGFDWGSANYKLLTLSKLWNLFAPLHNWGLNGGDNAQLTHWW